MIEIYEGRLGGGKSYSAVERALKYFASGGCVATNIELVWPACVDYCREVYAFEPDPAQYIALTDEQIPLFHRFTPSGTMEQPSLVIIDEAPIWFNSRDWNKQQRETLDFARQSRKCHTDIIFIAQAATQLDNQFRGLIQYLWGFRDLERWKDPILKIAYPFPHLMEIQKDYCGEVMAKRTKRKDKRIYRCYSTTQLLRTFPRLEGAVKRGAKIVKKGKKMRLVLILVAFAVLVVFAVFKFSDVRERFTSDRTAQPQPQKVEVAKPVAVSEPVMEIAESDWGEWTEMRGNKRYRHVSELTTDKDVYRLGQECRFGVVQELKRGHIVVLSSSGQRLVVPYRVKRVEKKQVTTASMISSAAKQAFQDDSGN
jgi:Zonular occludens toxin (Zot)